MEDDVSMDFDIDFEGLVASGSDFNPELSQLNQDTLTLTMKVW
jgi:hypothetical protein